MRTRFLLSLGTFLTFAAAAPADLLLDNGPYITSFGNGYGGADVSMVEPTYNRAGFNCSNVDVGNGPYRVADDFTVAGAAWTLDSMVIYAFQVHSPLTPTFTGAFVTVFDAGTMSPLYGNWTTDRILLGATSWSGTYRVLNTDPLDDSTRPVMAVAVDLTWLPDLAPGTYRIGVALTGSLDSGPWAVPRTPHLATDNGTQWVSHPTPGWYALDGNSGVPGVQPQDVAFELYGTTAGIVGDLNCDGLVNAFDIDPFILALTDEAAYAAAYPNCNRHLADTKGS